MKLITLLLLIGVLEVNGWAIEAKPEPFSQELFKRAEAGDSFAQWSLGRCYYKGIGVAQDYKEAVKWCTKSAEQGNARGQRSLATCYYFGNGVAQDYKEAVKWYTKSAEQGDAKAQSNLGVCYEKGTGVDKDEKQAVKWFTKSAEQGDATAQFFLGVCYANGKGVGKNEREAVKWYTKSADQGFALAQLQLSSCYYNGTGVDKDNKEAVKWLKQSAAQGLATAQYGLGLYYMDGIGADKDEKEAVKWFTKSAEQGFADAQYNLGGCYEKGQGVGKDEKEAVKWFTKLSSLPPKTKGSSDNYFIGLGSLETGNFTKAKQALLLAGNNYGPTAENIRPEHMRLINSSDHWGAFVLQILDNNGSIIGTGFFCDPNGWVLTAAHVVAGQEMITVRDREMNTWQVEGLFPGEFSSDLVLMKTSAHPRVYAKLAHTDSDVSDSVIQVGHPFGVLQQIVSEGKVENLNGNGGAWVCSMSAMPGNSGSPVFNQEWELVGITSKCSYFINSKKDSDPVRTWVVPLRELRKLFEAAKKVSFFQPVAMSKEWEKQSSFWNREEAKRARALLQARTLLYESYQDRDPQKAAAIIVTEAERGSSEAINLLGLITYQGEGVPKDPKKAFELWKGLAEQGDAAAQFNLGYCYEKGTGVVKDEKEAVKLYTKSAQTGNAWAQSNLGLCYANGTGVTQDYKEAVKWYTKSAEQGFADAQYNLG
ncbi:MAG: hypothetical protein EBT07_12690, partial [Actinobacteria bacterium]|nr:hypothetical protein [Actinomycetota bacterium]